MLIHEELTRGKSHGRNVETKSFIYSFLSPFPIVIISCGLGVSGRFPTSVQPLFTPDNQVSSRPTCSLPVTSNSSETRMEDSLTKSHISIVTFVFSTPILLLCTRVVVDATTLSDRHDLSTDASGPRRGGLIVSFFNR